MKSTVLWVSVALVIAITGGLLVSKFLANEVEIIFIDWENATIFQGNFTESDEFDQRIDNGDILRTSNEEIEAADALEFQLVKAGVVYAEDSSLKSFWLNGVARILGISFAVGMFFGVVTSLLIFAVVKIRNALSSGYGRLDEGELGEKETSMTHWKPVTWLLIGSTAAVFGSSITAALLVARQLVKIHSEGLL